jgi:CarD family transcriptional regulator
LLLTRGSSGRETKLVFEIGEGVVHPVHGAGVITDISCESLGGESCKYYVIEVVTSDMRLLVPVDNAEERGLRSVSGQAKVKNLLVVVSGPAESLPSEQKERSAMLSSVVSGEDTVRKAEALRDLSWRRRQQGLSGGDGRVFERLKQLLTGEIALGVGVSFDEAVTLLEKSMRKSFSESGM